MHFKWIELKFTKIIRKCKPKCFKTLMVVSLFIASVKFATNDAIRNSLNSILVPQDIMVGIAIYVEKKPSANLCNFGFYFQNKNKSKELVKLKCTYWKLSFENSNAIRICNLFAAFKPKQLQFKRQYRLRGEMENMCTKMPHLIDLPIAIESDIDDLFILQCQMQCVIYSPESVQIVA